MVDLDLATQDKLEAMVDAHGLKQVLAALGEICAVKAEHIASNWQDVSAAKGWMKARALINDVAEHPNVGRVS